MISIVRKVGSALGQSVGSFSVSHLSAVALCQRTIRPQLKQSTRREELPAACSANSLGSRTEKLGNHHSLTRSFEAIARPLANIWALRGLFCQENGAHKPH